MVRAIAAFMNFCYLVRQSSHTEDTLREIEIALEQFHDERDIFLEEGVRDNLSLPWQHALVHYISVIQMFGSPNGLCSSITESKHIKAVKEPWRRSNHYNALGQMLLTNQRNDKLAASTVDFVARGMLDGPITLVSHPPVTLPPDTEIDDDDDNSAAPTRIRIPPTVTLAKTHARGYSRSLETISEVFGVPSLPLLFCRFLYGQLYPNAPEMDIDEHLPAVFPLLHGTTRVYFSALAQFYAPSDYSGVGGMLRERIRATPSWHGGAPRNDCVFVYRTDHSLTLWSGFSSLHAARVVLFFSYKHLSLVYPCALVQWFRPVGNKPCSDTNMWIVERDWDEEADGEQCMSVIHCSSIYRAAHLIPVFGTESVDRNVSFSNSLDVYNRYYINKFIDHQSHELAF